MGRISMIYNGKIAGCSTPTFNGEIFVASAFFFKSNVYQEINAPSSATYAVAFGVNTSGLMVGMYVGSENDAHGFVFDETNFSTFDYPGATDTAMPDINDSGNIVETSR
jgi:hypothetical protein